MGKRKRFTLTPEMRVFLLPLPVINEWGIPDTLKPLFLIERMQVVIENRAKEYLKKASDLEMLAAFHQISLATPLDDHGAAIYTYLFKRVSEKWGIPFPDDIEVRELTEYEKTLLERARVKLRRDMLKAIRR